MRYITDISTLLGIVLAFGLVALAVTLGTSDPMGFFDPKSVLIVFGGTLGLTTACFTVQEAWRAIVITGRTMFYHRETGREAAHTALEIANLARKQGILALQKYEAVLKRNRLFRKGVMMIVDGIPEPEVNRLMTHQVQATLERHQRATAVLRKAAEISPAMGLIGTLIGLVQMLGNLSDPSTIGPAMAIALLTTLYGAMLAYMVFLPLASKLERNSTAEVIALDIYIKAVTSIARRENPRRLEMLINAVLPPSQRVNFFK